MPIVYDDREIIKEAANTAKAAKQAKQDKYSKENPTSKYTAQGYRSREADYQTLKNLGVTGLVADVVKNPGPVVSALVDDGSRFLYGDGSSAKEKKEAADKPNKNPLYSGLSGGSSSGKSSMSGSNSGNVAGINNKYQDIIDKANASAAANNEWSAKQAQIARDWEERMSNTAHQREVADLQAAGLNPVLSAGGSGASTPSAQLPQVDDSNTRILAEVALAGLEATASTAKSLGGSRKKTVKQASKAADTSILSKIGVSGAQGFARSLGYALGRAIFRH